MIYQENKTVKKQKSNSIPIPELELKGFSTNLMPSRCELCRINFETSLELDVHNLSLSHHIKLEAKGSEQHYCGICSFTCSTLSEYSKHVDSESHRKRRDRLRAVIDTMDAGESRNLKRRAQYDDRKSQVPNNYMEPRSSFVRNGNGRMTYPAPNMNNLPSGPPSRNYCYSPSNFSSKYTREKYNEYLPNSSSNHHFEKRAGHQDYDLPWNVSQLPSYSYGSKECYNAESSSSGFSQQNIDRRSYYGRSRAVEINERRDRWDERGRQRVEEKSEPLRKKVKSNVNPDVEDLPKKGLLARLSLRVKKEKDSLCKSKNKEREKQKCRSSSKNTDDANSPTIQPSFEGRSHSTEKKTKRKRIVPAQLPMKDRTKKWELVAVKGKASYLKNRSQRMMKDRMSKYRLVDKNGQLVEHIVEEDNQAVSVFSLNRDVSVSSVPSNIWGTGPEAHLQDSHDNISMQTGVSPSSPALITTPSLNVPPINETSMYASMHCNLPMSTPRHYGDAVRAYENCSDISINHVLNEVESALNNIQIPGNLNKASLCGQVNSIVPSILEDRSPLSRVDVTTVNSKPIEVVTIKSELNESPPPETLPSPPQFDLTMKSSSITDEPSGSTIISSREKEREEFWKLGVAEATKSREIYETVRKLEQLKMEMAAILQRKAELLGLGTPISNGTVV